MDDIKKNNSELINYFVTAFLSITGIFLLAVWFRIVPDQEIKLRIASTADKVLESLAVQKVNIKGSFIAFAGKASSVKGSWGGFRGRNHDNINREDVALIDIPDKSGIPVLWSLTLGEGYAGAAVKNGRVYILDYDKKIESDALRCFSFDSGEEIWQRSYRTAIKRNHGYSRTVPAVSDKYAVTIGPKGHVMCVDALTGDFKWGIDLETEYSSKIPLWYMGQCPVIDGSAVVIAPAGKALFIGVDLETGKVIWETPNPGKFKMSHSSIIPMTFYDKKMYVYCALGGMTGVSASGEDRGAVLWQTDEWTHSVISPSPVKVSGNRISVSAGYGKGSMMFKVIKNEDGFRINKLFELDKKIFASEQHTPIFYKGHLYSVLPSDAGELNRQLVCMTPEGKPVWNSGKENRFGLGPFIIADGKIFILDDNGVLTAAETGTEHYKELYSIKVLSGRESWGPIAVSDGRMLLRDYGQLVCLDMRSKNGK